MPGEAAPVRVLRLRGQPADWGLRAAHVRTIASRSDFAGVAHDAERMTGIEPVSPLPVRVLLLATPRGEVALEVRGEIDVIVVDAHAIEPLPSIMFADRDEPRPSIVFADRAVILFDPAEWSPRERGDSIGSEP